MVIHAGTWFLRQFPLRRSTICFSPKSRKVDDDWFQQSAKTQLSTERKPTETEPRSRPTTSKAAILLSHRRRDISERIRLSIERPQFFRRSKRKSKKLFLRKSTIRTGKRLHCHLAWKWEAREWDGFWRRAKCSFWSSKSLRRREDWFRNWEQISQKDRGSCIGRWSLVRRLR